MKEHRSHFSLRKKILSPFLVLMLCLCVILVSGIFYFLSDLQMKDYRVLLDKDHYILSNWLQNKQQTQLALTQTLPQLRYRDLKRLLQADPEQQDIQVFVQLDAVPELYQDFFVSYLQNKPKQAQLEPVFLSDNQRHELIFIGAILRETLENDILYMSLQTFDDSVLESLELSGEPTLFYVAEGSAEPLLMSSRIFSDPILQEKISKLLIKHASNLEGLHMFSLDKKEFLLSFRTSPSTPSLYTLVLIEKSNIFFHNLHLLFVILGIILFSCLLIYFIYAIIIGKIITSIDVLSDVAARVSDGDLEQKVYLNSNDEIGHLSTTFNQMISNLKKSSLALLQEKQQSERILNNVPVGIVVTDNRYQLSVANEEAERMFKFQDSDSQGTALLTELSKRSVLTKAKNQVLTFPYEDSSESSPRLFELRSQVLDRDNKAHVLTVIRDLTHEKEIERLRDAFLRTVTHELRTPLTSVIGYIELVQQSAKKNDKTRKEYLNTALTEARSLQRLINDLLDLSQLNAGKMKMTYTRIKITPFLDEIIKTLKPLATGKKLTLKRLFKDTEFSVSADKDKLRRILMNLCSNAIKFTEKGHIHIDCEDQTDTVKFSVSDSGIGLKKEQQEIIFEHFRQIDDSSTRKYEGIGLGLAIVKELVELHHGSIQVDSDYGKGATFSFTIKKTV